MRINNSGNVGIGTTDPKSRLHIDRRAHIGSGASYAIDNNFMQTGSLTIGSESSNYGGGNNWNANTAGLMMECADNTEIAVHDSGHRVASLMYYEGGPNNYKITIGRNMGWNAISNLVLNGNVSLSAPIINQFWRLTNESDYLRLYNAAGTAYFRFAARELWSETSLQVNTTANIVGVLTMGNGINFKTDVWNTSTDGRNRIYYGNNSTSYYQGYGNSSDFAINHEFRNHAGDARFVLYNVAAAGARLYGQFTCDLFSVNYVGYDDVGVTDVGGTGQQNAKTLYQIWNSFTAFHRCFTDDELFNIDNPQEFKDTYMGRIVVSTGTIKTHSSTVKENKET
jgi:hypothetical protein